MTLAATELPDFIKDKEIEYHFGFDYGMGSVEICNESNGKIKWSTELNK